MIGIITRKSENFGYDIDMAPRIVICLCLLGLILTDRSTADEPSTQPVAIDSVSNWIAGLESSNPQERDQAFQHLLSLDSSQLPALHDAVKRMETVSLAQSIAMKNVVMHVHVTGQHHFTGTGRALLGVTRTNIDFRDSSCIIAGRRIGFDAYRVLRDGDQITRMAKVDPQDGSLAHAIDVTQFSQMQNWMIEFIRPGDTIEATVIRSGEQLNLRLRVAPDPDRRDDQSSTNYTRWLNNALDYWNAQFEPIVSARSNRS